MLNQNYISVSPKTSQIERIAVIGFKMRSAMSNKLGESCCNQSHLFQRSITFKWIPKGQELQKFQVLSLCHIHLYPF